MWVNNKLFSRKRDAVSKTVDWTVRSSACSVYHLRSNTHHTTPHHTTPYHTTPHHTTPYHTTPHHTTTPSGCYSRHGRRCKRRATCLRKDLDEIFQTRHFRLCARSKACLGEIRLLNFVPGGVLPIGSIHSVLHGKLMLE